MGRWRSRGCSHAGRRASCRALPGLCRPLSCRVRAIAYLIRPIASLIRLIASIISTPPAALMSGACCMQVLTTALSCQVPSCFASGWRRALTRLFTPIGVKAQMRRSRHRCSGHRRPHSMARRSRPRCCGVAAASASTATQRSLSTARVRRGTRSSVPLMRRMVAKRRPWQAEVAATSRPWTRPKRTSPSARDQRPAQRAESARAALLGCTTSL